MFSKIKTKYEVDNQVTSKMLEKYRFIEKNTILETKLKKLLSGLPNMSSRELMLSILAQISKIL